MKKYIRIMRLDHWIKQFFVLPGVVCAMLLANKKIEVAMTVRFILGMAATCFIASANYVINEWLDAEFDKYHPTKKNRSVVTEDVKKSVVWILWGVLTAIALILSYNVNVAFLVSEVWLWVMGILYNVKPMRTKDIPIIDVLSESLNNAIRLLLGWFIVVDDFLPPCSLVLGYWMAGAFLMAIKRYAEYKMIDNPELAGQYRKSFRFYSEKSLLMSSFFYAMTSVLFIGIFLIKYRVELIVIMPFLIGLYCMYFYISFKEDSAVQKPEKLYKEKGLMVYCIVLIILFMVLMKVDIPVVRIFTDTDLVKLAWL